MSIKRTIVGLLSTGALSAFLHWLYKETALKIVFDWAFSRGAKEIAAQTGLPESAVIDGIEGYAGPLIMGGIITWLMFRLVRWSSAPAKGDGSSALGKAEILRAQAELVKQIRLGKKGDRTHDAGIAPPPLEILFDHTQSKYVALRRERCPTMPSGARNYMIEVRNTLHERSIEDVVITWDKTPFTQLVDLMTKRDGRPLSGPIVAIHPYGRHEVWLFGTDKKIHPEAGNDALRKRSTFTVRAIGKDAREVSASFEYNPRRDIKVKRLP